MFETFLGHYLRAGSFSISVLSIMVLILSVYLTTTVWPTDRRNTTKVLGITFILLFLGLSTQNVFFFLFLESIPNNYYTSLHLIALAMINDFIMLLGVSCASCFMFKMLFDKYYTGWVIAFIGVVTGSEFFYSALN